MNSQNRVFAIVPAAGLSRRMGRPKLILPLGDSTVIEIALAAIAEPRVCSRVVVARSVDVALHGLIEQAGAELVCPADDPTDMRQSVEAALAFIDAAYDPTPGDAWMLAPADSVGLAGSMVSELLSVWGTSTADILVPRCGEKTGHPALFRWWLADRLRGLDAAVGVNALKKLSDVVVQQHAVDDLGVLQDLDTPAEYDAQLKLRRRPGSC